MALPVFTYFNSNMVGAPALSGQNGTYNAVMDWVMVTLGGHTRVYHDGASNQSVYKFVGGGEQYMYVCHNSAISGEQRKVAVRMAEGATGYTYSDLSGPYPTQSQKSDADASFLVSTSAISPPVARYYEGFVGEGTLIFCTQADGTNFHTGYWGDTLPTDPVDAYAQVAYVRTGNVSMNAGFGTGTAYASQQLFWRRSRDGTVASTSARLSVNSAYTIGGVAFFPSASSVWDGAIAHEALAVDCAGQQSNSNTADAIKATAKRGWLYNLRTPLVNGIGTYSPGDVFTDGSYAPGCELMLSFSQSGVGVLFQRTNDWSTG
jgi:hypothetical protein